MWRGALLPKDQERGWRCWEGDVVVWKLEVDLRGSGAFRESPASVAPNTIRLVSGAMETGLPWLGHAARCTNIYLNSIHRYFGNKPPVIV